MPQATPSQEDGLSRDPHAHAAVTVSWQGRPGLSTRHVLRVLLAGTLLAVVVLAIAAAWGLDSIGQRMRREQALDQQTTQAVYALRAAVDRVSIAGRDYALTRSPADLQAWRTARVRQAEAMRTLDSLPLAPPQQRELAAVRAVDGPWNAELARATTLAQQGRSEAASRQLGQAVVLGHQQTRHLDALLAATSAEFAARQQQAYRQQRSMHRLLVALSVLCVPLVAALVWFASVRVLRPLRYLERSAQRLRQGDFSTRVDIVANDEFGAVAQSINAMAASVETSMTSLRESEDRLRSMLAALHEGVMLQDAHRRVLVANESAERLLGIRAEQLLGSPGLPERWRFVTADGAPFPAEALPTSISLATGRPCRDVELGLVKPDGTHAWLSVSSQPLFRPEEAAPYAVVTSFVDVTERRRAEQEQRQFELLVKSVMDYAIYLLDPEGRVVTWNKGAEALKGYSEAEIVGRPHSDFFTPEARAAGAPEAMLQKAAAQGRVEEEGWRVRKDGSRFWADVVLTALRDDSGRLVGFAKVTRDLTERKRHEECLRENTRQLAQQERLLAGIIEHMPAAIAYVDRELVYRWNNPAHCAQMGLPREAIVGHSVFEVLPGTESELRPRYERVLETGKPLFVTAMPLVYERNGQRHEQYWDTAYVPIADDGEVTGILMLGLEVSDRVAHERAQAAVIENLESIDRMKDEFLSVLSHELRTPINAIMGFGSILDDELAGPLNAQQHQYVQKMLNGSDLLLALVNDLLDMGRIRAGKLTVDRRALDFGAIARQILGGLEPLVARKALHLTTDVPATLPPVLGDEQRVGQVLTNLVSNAIKFTPNDGAITVRACLQRGMVRGEVQDTGTGIAAEDLPRLFQRFTQLDSSYTRAVGGTGLGLSICKALVEAMGGEIGVESTPGIGSTFWFTLPRADGAQPSPER